MEKVIIPKNLAQEDLVVIPRSQYERLLAIQKPPLSEDESVTEDDVLQWSKEARTMKQNGALPVLTVLKDLR